MHSGTVLDRYQFVRRLTCDATARYLPGMEIRRLTPDYAVSPQIAAADIPAIADAGYCMVICNRPDSEVPPGLQAAAIRAAAEAAGLGFVVNPIVHGSMGPEEIARQKAAMAEGPALAYCASGTRCTVIWMLGEAEQTAPDALLAAAREAGYALDPLRPELEARHRG